MGPTRSTRLPVSLDAWFDERLMLHREQSASELLVALIHGGLRLREGYMAIHRRALERFIVDGRDDAYDTYVEALLDTFGAEYVSHLENWLKADGFSAPLKQAASENGRLPES